jgi:hypothetical protein
MYNSIALLIGHMAGDYLLQNDWMAVNKSQSTAKGLVACNLHCLLYSLAVATVVCLGGWVVVGAELFVFGRSINWIVAFLIAYVCHFPIDRWGLAGKYMKWFGQTLPDKLDSTWVQVARPEKRPWEADNVQVYTGPRQYFWAPVMIAVDNTMHLVLMWALYSFFGQVG